MYQCNKCGNEVEREVIFDEVFYNCNFCNSKQVDVSLEVTDIVWDIDDVEIVDLPTSLLIDVKHLNIRYSVADYLTDNYGYLVVSYEF